MIKLPITFLLLILGASVNAQDWDINSKKTLIELKDETFYTKKVVIHGRSLSSEVQYYPIRNSVLDSVQSVRAFLLIKGKQKAIKEKEWMVSSLSRSFKSDVEIIGIPVKPFHEFEIEIFYHGSEPMIIADVQVTDPETDSMETTLLIPDGWTLSKMEDHAEYYDFNISKGLVHTIYNFLAQQKQDSHYVPVILHPSKKSPIKYLGEWYDQHLSVIEPISLSTINEMMPGLIEDTIQFVQKVYENVQDKIAYIDIEDALGAFIPRSPNSTWNNKYGDCKDMSFLIYSILKSKGIETNLAISRSLSLSQPFNFPSIALANHVICVAYINDKLYYLDATDEDCSFGNPSSHTQNCEIFIVDGEKSRFDTVRMMKPSENLDSTYIYISLADNAPSTFNRMIIGKTAKPYLRYHENGKQSELNEYFKDAFDFDISHIQYTVNSEQFGIAAAIALSPSKLSSYSNNILVPYSLLLDIPELTVDTSASYLPLYQTFLKKQSTVIEFELDIAAAKYDWSYDNQSFLKFNYEVRIDGKKLIINETFELNKVGLNKDEIIVLGDFLRFYQARKEQLLTVKLK